ncbi:uncharacterized protein EDB93DRAFT_1105867 [Suillus bovinus]|uniref:uncharacterized protein n=1 Tax=Suillus bovinus TaxID=48563 RepID=UPI001B8783E0|nr:uncharacterized protein EDB93DRAFT_1105867 [Suillus bovinus]KAG2140955.1 hypothetical protein EDB93DRAFT_1105867 [Suillus bovinus]
MHHALKVDDIVYEILQYVKLSKSDLHSMAMTCSTFSSPALDMLWCQQDSLIPLVKCLPQDTWNVRYDGTIIFSREPLLPEWERVRIYAARIRKLTVTQYDRSPKLSGPVLRQLFALFPPAMLFPRLRTLDSKAVYLDWVDFDPAFFLSLLRQFFLLELENLKFEIPDGATAYEVQQLFGDLSTNASCLRQWAIHYPHQLLPFVVPKLPKLNGLTIGRISTNLMRQNIANIQHSRCLQTLTLTVDGSNKMEIQPPGDMPLEFGALENLKLSGVRLAHCKSFLDQVAMPQLAVLEIHYFGAAKPAEITGLIKSLSTACNTIAFLKEITVVAHSHHNWNHLEPGDQLHSNIFRPLLKFRSLHCVQFMNIGEYCLDDEFLEDIAVAWPDLRMLKFAAETHARGRVTLTGMLSLATRCKSLRFLQLTFDARHFPTLPRAPDGNLELWTMQTTLRWLHVECSKVSEASHLHLLLAVLFPNLACLYYSPHCSGADPAWGRLKTAWRNLKIRRKKYPYYAVSWSNTLLQLQPGLDGEMRDEEGEGEEGRRGRRPMTSTYLEDQQEVSV